MDSEFILVVSLHSVYFFNEPLHVLNHILESLTLKTAMFVCFMVVMQAAILLFGKGVFEQVTINIIVLIVSIIVFN